MIPLMSPKRNPKFKCASFLLIPTSSVEGRDTCMDLENFPDLVMITRLRWWNTLNNKIPKVCVQRQRKRQIGTHFSLKKRFPTKKKYPVTTGNRVFYQDTGMGCPVVLFTGFPFKVSSGMCDDHPSKWLIYDSI